MTSDAYRRLSAMVAEAEALIAKEGAYFTKGSLVAMEDLIKRSKDVLAGDYKVPFVRNRAFYKPRPDEEILFATERLTKTPSYRMTEYGFAPAFEWFKGQHMMNESDMGLAQKQALVIEQASHLLDQSGQEFDPDQVAHVRRMLEAFKTTDHLSKEDLSLGIVALRDAIRDLLHSRSLLTDKDPASTLFFSSEGLDAFRKRVTSDPELIAEVEAIKRISDRNSPEDIEAIRHFMTETTDYATINQSFNPWSTTAKTINFTSPKDGVAARLQFILPSKENQVDGLGHVWIDDVKIYSESGPNWPISNPGFDEGTNGPKAWRQVALKGQPKFAWVAEPPFNDHPSLTPEGVFGHGTPEEETVASRSKSVYIENPSPEDEGAWVYDGPIAIEPGCNNTITFFAKVDGKFKEGLRIVVTFLNQQGAEVSQFEHYFNKKSSYGTGDYSLTVQTDAIMYAITKDLTYAKKVKTQLQFILNDFCQGIEHWLVLGSRPDDSDAYGAVQGGRIMCSIMSAYSLIQGADLFNESEMSLMMAQLDYFVRFHMDLRDRTELSPYEAQQDAGNWQTDMAAGTGMLMMAMPDFPNARQWLENANMVLRSQLKLKVKADGSWPESIRYHFAALSRFLIYGRVLRNCTGENWFQDGPLIKMFKYVTEMTTPPYSLRDDHISTIPFGDHVLDGGRGFVLAGAYYDEVLKYDQEVAHRMYHSWKKAGSIRGFYRGEAVALENLFAPGVVAEALAKMPEVRLKSCKDYPESGIYTFRKDYGRPTESLCAIQASPTLISHGHYDVGSFIIFKNCQPIVVDLGINGYFDSSKDWFISSSSHNVLQFSRKDGKAAPQAYTIHLMVSDYSARQGWLDGLRTCQVEDCQLTDQVDTIQVEMKNPEGQGTHTRQVTFYREPEMYVVTDTVKDFQEAVRFNLNVASTDSLVMGKQVYCVGSMDVDLEVIFLSDLDHIKVEKGRTAPHYPEVNGDNLVDIIRAQSSGGQGFRTLIYPKAKGEGPLKVDKTNNELRITRADGKVLVLKENEHV